MELLKEEMKPVHIDLSNMNKSIQIKDESSSSKFTKNSEEMCLAFYQLDTNEERIKGCMEKWY